MTKQVYYEHLNINYYTIKTEREWAEVFKKENGRMAKCITFSPSIKDILKVRKELDELENIVYFGSGNHSTEINFKGVSKGNSVKVLSEKYGIKREELICIGDNENDISMIKYAGLGIAMANAIDEVKSAAQYITDSNKNDGVAKAIKKFILD
ncbi:HAD-IIB family hydrolase, partial [Clostridium saudiense]|nr:HAD-IIB family hydrolase [Clostridium saudiense]